MAHLLDTVPLLLGWLWPLLDSRGRTFADMLARTEVHRIDGARPDRRHRAVAAMVVAAVLSTAIVTAGYFAVYRQETAIAHAREQIAVVVFSQVNDEPMRREKDHRPQLRDCAGSRDPAKGCKLALGLYRPAMYDGSADVTDGELLILKNNQGETGVRVPIRLDLATHTIRDVPESAEREQRRMGGM